MIFNSITRDLNQQDSSRKKQYPQQNSQLSYFPQRQFAPSNIFQNIPEATYPQYKNDSALAKMNDKLSGSIEYLRYKDKLRTNQLRSSRISVSSNRSHRSTHSNKSVKSYLPAPTAYFPGTGDRAVQNRSYLPSEQSKIKTFVPPQTYSNQNRPSKSNYNYWKQQAITNKYQNKVSNNEFKYFTRNPVTIDTNYYPTESRQPQRDVNQSIQRSVHSNNSESLYDFTNQKSKLNTIQTEYPKPTSGIEWNASFGSSMRNSKVTPNNQKTTNVPPNESLKNEGISKSDTAESLSPLSKVASPKKSKNGLIISAGLIALGVLILLLQILK